MTKIAVKNQSITEPKLQRINNGKQKRIGIMGGTFNPPQLDRNSVG